MARNQAISYQIDIVRFYGRCSAVYGRCTAIVRLDIAHIPYRYSADVVPVLRHPHLNSGHHPDPAAWVFRGLSDSFGGPGAVLTCGWALGPGGARRRKGRANPASNSAGERERGSSQGATFYESPAVSSEVLRSSLNCCLPVDLPAPAGVGLSQLPRRNINPASFAFGAWAPSSRCGSSRPLL